MNRYVKILVFLYQLPIIFAPAIFQLFNLFSDPSKVKPGLVDYSGLYAAGIWVLRPDYIVDYLTIDPPPPTLKYVIPEVQKLMESAAKISNSNEPKKRKKLDETSSQKMKRSRK